MGKLLGGGFALLLLAGCTGGTGAGQETAAPLDDTGIRAQTQAVDPLPAPVGTGSVPVATLPEQIDPGAMPDTQPATVPGVDFQKVTCGTATMDLPTNLHQVSQYGDRDVTTTYASADGKTTVELECRDRQATDSPNTDFQNTVNGLTKKPDYTYNKNNKWVVTGPGLLCAGNCAGADTSEYYKAAWYNNSKVFSMLWQYPASEDKALTPTIAHVYYSFNWNGGTSNPVAPGQTQQPVLGANQARTTSELSLREGPDCKYARLDKIPNGAVVNVDRAAVGPEDGWYMVEYQGKTGWASGWYLEGQNITTPTHKLCQN